MKKTVTVNISGIIFHIDEDAYDKLFDYLDEIRGYLSSTEGKEEIIADVEARIAEMLQQKVSEFKQVINIEDVAEVISLMGEPAQFGAEPGTENKKKREPSSTAKRFYRDPDNKVIGGVCSGIANYFHIDSLWVRIIFAVALLGFGSGLLLYIFLWIITPEARTTAEKLEMRGETVNIYNIEKSVKEELSQLKKRFKNIKKKENLNSADERKNIHSGNFFERIVQLFITLLKVCVRVLVIIFGIVLIFIGIFLLTGFLGTFIRSGDVISVTNIGITKHSVVSFLQLVIDSPAQTTMVTLGLILLVGIPLLMLIYNGIKMIFGFKSRFKIIGISAFSIWLTGLILCVFVFLKVLSDFSAKVVIPKKYNLTQSYKKHIYIDIKSNDSIENYMEYNPEFVNYNWYLIKLDDRK
jgi:phage shock protein PspC (stress-responsive transcriptional regulator)